MQASNGPARVDTSPDRPSPPPEVVLAPPIDEPVAIGDSLSHYRVEERLGTGGAGVVYRAVDTRLERSVALKFLSRYLAETDEWRERFTQEARAASALDHPNICTIYEVGEADDGQLFIAMACYDGETLAARIARGPLPIGEVVDLGAQTARGLAKAHRTGIVHRDIKPANLFVTQDGIVKILDFGIAKVSNQQLTRTGWSLGTMAYMSPEQLSGEPVDHTTDLWSLGVVFHEMLTGRPLFGGGSDWGVMSSIMTESVPSAVSRRPDCPVELSDLIASCLAQKPRDRIASADLLVQGLEAIGRGLTQPVAAPAATGGLRTGPVAAAAPSDQIGIVVKPFEDISPDRDNGYFSDGLTEEIITDLSGIKALRVISRASAMQLKGRDTSAGAIGRELNVRYVLEGGVRKQGDRLRVTARLIETETESQVWAEKFAGTMRDVFDIQERVSFSVMGALRVQTTPTEKRRLIARPIDSAAAYECYLRGREQMWGMTPEAMDRAEARLREGLAIVGENAVLLAGLGQVSWQRANLGVRTAESLADAATHAQRALALDAACPQAEYLLGMIAASRGEMLAAVNHMRRTLEIDPNSADALSALVLFYGFLGRATLAFPLLERLTSIDPLTAMHHASAAWLHLTDGRFDRAVEEYRVLGERNPGVPLYQFSYGHALALSGAADAACEVLEALERGAGGALPATMGQMLRLALQGRDRDLTDLVTPELEAFSSKGTFASWLLAECFALIGDEPKATRWLEGAVDLGFINYPLLSRLDPLLAKVRESESFQRLMGRVRDVWERCEV